MKYAVCWVQLGSPAGEVYEIYDTAFLDTSYLRSVKIAFISDTPGCQKLWHARLIIWYSK